MAAPLNGDEQSVFPPGCTTRRLPCSASSIPVQRLRTNVSSCFVTPPSVAVFRTVPLVRFGSTLTVVDPRQARRLCPRKPTDLCSAANVGSGAKGDRRHPRHRPFASRTSCRSVSAFLASSTSLPVVHTCLRLIPGCVSRASQDPTKAIGGRLGRDRTPRQDDLDCHRASSARALAVTRRVAPSLRLGV